MRKLAAILLAFACLLSAAAVPAVVQYVGGVPGQVNVNDFGAVANGLDDCTQAFSDAAYYLKRRYGGGTILCGAGTYVIQGAPILEGVYVRGVGARSGTIDKAATTFALPRNATPNVAMWRVPAEVTTPLGYTTQPWTVDTSTDIVTTEANHGWTVGQPVKVQPQNGPLPSGLNTITIAYVGPTTNGGSVTARGFRLYNSSANAVTGGATGVVDFTNVGFVFTAATTDVCTSTEHGFEPGAAVQVSSSNTLPAGLSAGTTYYVGQNSGSKFKLYTNSANAITGGSTGVVDITGTGTGTHSVFRVGATTASPHIIRSVSTIASFTGGGFFDIEFDGRGFNGSPTAPTAPSATAGPQLIGVDFTAISDINTYNVERCYFHNFDIAFRGGTLGEVRLTMDACEFWYNFVACQIGEQPLISNCTLMLNYYALAGRFVDGTILNCYINENYVGVSGYNYPYVLGENAGITESNAASQVNTMTMTGGALFNNRIVGMVMSTNSTMNGVLVVGTNTHTADGGSVGVRVQGRGNKILGCVFGEGTASSTFSRAAIVLDTGGSSDLQDTLIQGNRFDLACCPAIQCGNSMTRLYGAAAIGSIFGVTVSNNTFGVRSHRILDVRTTTGTCGYWLVVGNMINHQGSGSDGSNVQLASTDALIEGNFRYSTFSNNYFFKNGGLSTARGISNTWGSGATSCQYLANRFEGWTSTNQNINIAAGGGDALTQLANNWYSGGGASIGATDSTLKANNVGP